MVEGEAVSVEGSWERGVVLWSRWLGGIRGSARGRAV